MTWRSKIPYYAIMVTMFMSIALLVSFMIAMLYPYNLVDYHYDKYKVLTPVVKRGENVVFESEFYKNTNLPATVSRQLINSNIYVYSDVVINNPAGPNKLKMTIQIPDFVEPGIYYIKSTVRYKVNFLRTITYVNDSETFQVTE